SYFAHPARRARLHRSAIDNALDLREARMDSLLFVIPSIPIRLSRPRPPKRRVCPVGESCASCSKAVKRQNAAGPFTATSRDTRREKTCAASPIGGARCVGSRGGGPGRRGTSEPGRGGEGGWGRVGGTDREKISPKPRREKSSARESSTDPPIGKFRRS